MALATLTKFEQICRTCMADRNTFHSLFDYVDACDNEKIQISELLCRIIYQLPKIEVMNDKLPKNICSSCVEKLLNFSEFQNCCISSDLQLRQQFNGNFTPFDVIVGQSDPLNENLIGIDEQIKEELIEDFSMIGACEATAAKVFPNVLVNNKTDSGKDADNSTYVPNNEMWHCSLCKKFFSQKASLLRHKKKFHKNEDWKKLNTTGKKARTCKLENHNEIVFDSKESNEHCLQRVKEEIILENSNEECGQSETSNDTKNKKKLNSKLNKSCELCDQTYRTITKLLEHYTNIHPDRLNSDELPVPEALKYIYCPYCKKGVKHATEHLRSHTKERPFLCPSCGKGYSSSTSLNQHMLRHTEEKRYSCQECPKKFNCLSDLCAHRKTHKKDKTHVCDICGNAFKQTHELTVHKRIHAERKYKCEQCGKDFGADKHLRRHMLTHSGEKPYKCKYCPRSFSQSNDMIKHLRTHVGNNVYQCELCPAAFPKAGERRIHFATHINDDEETRERNKHALIEAQEKLRQKLQLDKSTANVAASNS